MSTEYLVLDNADPNGLTIEIQEHSNKFDIALCTKECQDEEVFNPITIEDLSQTQLEGLAIQLIKVASYWNTSFVDELLKIKETDIWRHPIPVLDTKEIVMKVTVDHIGKSFITLVPVTLLKGVVLESNYKVVLDFKSTDPSELNGYYKVDHPILGVHKFFLKDHQVKLIEE